MPRHSFRFPPHIRDAVRRHVENAVSATDPKRYRQGHAYCVALASKLEGIAYETQRETTKRHKFFTVFGTAWR